MDSELITFLALCEEIEEVFDESTSCILVKVGFPGEELSIMQIYKTIQNFRDKAYDFIEKLDPSLQVDFEIYEFD
jgi:hypothetical protein